MAYVITRLCRDCVDGACVDACPVDCILEHRPSGEASTLPRQLFIDPAACICCRECEPVCPWEAIYEEGDVPAAFADDVELNAQASVDSKEYHVPTERLLRGASAEQVRQNFARWGLPR
jgi:ferredoxin